MQSLISTLSRYVLVLSFFLAPFIGQSQIGSPKKVDSTGRFVPEAIKVVNIIQKVEEANEEIKSTKRRTSSDRDVRRINSLLHKRSARITLLRQTRTDKRSTI